MTEISARVEVFLPSTTVATKSNELDLAADKREREIRSASSSQSSLSFLPLLACDEKKIKPIKLATKNPIEEKRELMDLLIVPKREKNH